MKAASESFSFNPLTSPIIRFSADFRSDTGLAFQRREVDL